MNFKEKYDYYKNIIDDELHKYLDNLQVTDKTLIDAMRYSVFAGGKRIRPVIMLAISEILNVDFKDTYYYNKILKYKTINYENLIQYRLPH